MDNNSTKTKIIEVIEATEISTPDGKKFWAFKTVLKNGKIATLKFRRDVQNIPHEKCFLEVPIDAISVDNSKRYIEVWVSDILNKFTENPEEAERREKRRKQIEEMF